MNLVLHVHQAAKKGHVEAVVAMLEEGCPINIVNNVGATVLHYAAEGGHVEVVRELVVRGCDVNAVKCMVVIPSTLLLLMVEQKQFAN